MYLIDTYVSTPENPSKGGAEKQLYMLATSLDPDRFKPVVVQLHPGNAVPFSEGRMGNLDLFHLPTRRICSPDGIRRLGQIRRLAKEKRTEIIHTFFEKSEVMGWLTARSLGIPIWVTSRRDLGFKRKEIYKKIFKLAKKDCRKCVANCLAVMNQAIQCEELPGKKMEVIYNGLDFSIYQDLQSDGTLRQELRIKDTMPIIGMVANFNFEIKGHRFFLEAAKIVLEKIPHAFFILIGDGPLRKQYEQMAKELGIGEQVRFLGKRNDVPSIISNLNISVMSSTSEGLSNIILESMAAGKPVVVTNVGGSSEIVMDGVNGYLVSPADPPAMANAILNLLQNPEKAIQIGNAGKKLVQEKFSVDAMVRSYEKLYMELMKKVRGTAL